VVGNSIGGWVALELAEVREVASLTLLAPAGLWRDRTPRYCRLSLWLTGWLARHLTSLLVRAVGTRAGRVLVLGQTHGRPAAISADYARDAVRDLAASAGFFPTLQATLPRHYAARGALDAPVTVVFGSRDLVLLPWQARQLEQLPPHRRAADLARCGHLPMADDPAAVVASIVASTAAFRADNAGSG
jgi:pimeloyl-ACP methyl ester carboxylesterase